jgi:hypothetical protein
MDDIPGRLIGMKVGIEAFEYATRFFQGKSAPPPADSFRVFPNPTPSAVQIELPGDGEIHVSVFSAEGKLVKQETLVLQTGRAILNLGTLPPGAYHLAILDDYDSLLRQTTIIKY